MQEQEEYIIVRDDDDDDEIVAPPPKAETEATPEDEAKTEPSADETKTAVKPDKTKATHEAKSDAPPPKCNAWCAVGRRALPSWAWAMLATFAMSFLLTAAFAGGYNYGRVAPAAPGGAVATSGGAPATSGGAVAEPRVVAPADACASRDQVAFVPRRGHSFRALDYFFDDAVRDFHRSLFSPLELLAPRRHRHHHHRRERRAAPYQSRRAAPFRHAAPYQHLHRAAPYQQFQLFFHTPGDDAVAAPERDSAKDAAPPQNAAPPQDAAQDAARKPDEAVADSPRESDRGFADPRETLREPVEDAAPVRAPAADRAAPTAVAPAPNPRRPTATTSDRAALRGLTIKQLQKILAKHGRACPTCKEKDDLVNEVIHALND